MSDFSREAILTCRKHGRFSWDDSRVCPSCPDPNEEADEREDCMDIEIPIKIGFYWFKHFETQRWRTTEVFCGADNTLCAYNTWEKGFFDHDKIDSNSSIYSAVEEFEGEWYGPIEDPGRGRFGKSDEGLK